MHRLHAVDDSEYGDQLRPQVCELLAAIEGEVGREALHAALGLSDRKSFREHYLKPALATA